MAILFAVMSFFYKYVDLSTYNQLQAADDTSSDETRALILSHEKQQEQQEQNGRTDERGNESEF